MWIEEALKREEKKVGAAWYFDGAVLASIEMFKEGKISSEKALEMIERSRLEFEEKCKSVNAEIKK